MKKKKKTEIIIFFMAPDDVIGRPILQGKKDLEKKVTLSKQQ
jgi:hypothetical protein